MAYKSGVVPPYVLYVGGVAGASSSHVGYWVLEVGGLSVVLLCVRLIGLVIVPVVGTVLCVGRSDMELFQIQYLLFKFGQSVIQFFRADSFLWYKL